MPDKTHPPIPPKLQPLYEAAKKLAKTKAMLRRATVTKEMLDNIEVKKTTNTETPATAHSTSVPTSA